MPNYTPNGLFKLFAATNGHLHFVNSHGKEWIYNKNRYYIHKKFY